ncbi:MAG: hypothetical protein KF861_09895 [Planctomycetaceae bacterium]|nr:hypothetical protein [Planctomycetaceae bacterium]
MQKQLQSPGGRPVTVHAVRKSVTIEERQGDVHADAGISHWEDARGRVFRRLADENGFLCEDDGQAYSEVEAPDCV